MLAPLASLLTLVSVCSAARSSFAVGALSYSEFVSSGVASTQNIPNSCGICEENQALAYDASSGKCECLGGYEGWRSYPQYCSPPVHSARGIAVCADRHGCGIFCKDDLILNETYDDCVCPPGFTIVVENGYFHCKKPQPTHKPYRRDSTQLSFESQCPGNEAFCPIPGSKGYECLDVSSSIQSCGGCIGQGGVDCTQAAEGVQGVGCAKGACVVLGCKKGYAKIGERCVSTSD